NHPANPMDPDNLVDLQAKVRESDADIGLAFDGDADRCFVIDERGEPVPPSAVTALVATQELEREPGATIIHNLITSLAVSEIVEEKGGTPIRTRVGHSFIKARMAETGAIFGGEHSAHYYFRDFWRADTGMLAAMHVLRVLGMDDRPLSQITEEYSRYVASGEINSEVADAAGRTAAVREAFAGREGAVLDELEDSPSRSRGDPGSICVRPTPNRCCGSTSRPPTSRAWRRCATRSWPSYAPDRASWVERCSHREPLHPVHDPRGTRTP